VGEDDGVVVDVGDPGSRIHPLGDLVDIALGGKPGADVDELVDPGLSEVRDGPLEEPAVLPGDHGRRTPSGSLVQLVGGGSVDLKVALAAKVLIIYWAGTHTFRPERGCAVSV
jgi:hypothetical protein